jgi:hypothetical protein
MPDEEIQMPDPNTIDGVLMTWGDRLFYPGNRSVKARPEPKLAGRPRPSAATIRERIAATVVRRAPQVMVKVTGGGRGMKATAAHMRYISKNGRLTIEDEQGRKVHGRDALREIEVDWRFGGSRIADTSPRREAFNIMRCGARAWFWRLGPRSSRHGSQTKSLKFGPVVTTTENCRAIFRFGPQLGTRKARSFCRNSLTTRPNPGIGPERFRAKASHCRCFPESAAKASLRPSGISAGTSVFRRAKVAPIARRNRTGWTSNALVSIQTS